MTPIEIDRRGVERPKSEKPPAGHRQWLLEVYQKEVVVSSRLPPPNQFADCSPDIT
jgi:hypothetical protein